MSSKFNHSLAPDRIKFWCLTLVLLFDVAICLKNTAYSQAESFQEKLRGSFSKDPTSNVGAETDNLIFPSIAFLESDGGEKYAIYSRSFFNLYPGREYIVNGVRVRKHLPDKPKSVDYRQLIQSAWPDIESVDLRSITPKIEAWIKNNPSKQLLLISSVHIADSLPFQDRNPLRVEENVQMSKLIKRVHPIHPAEASKYHISGKVILQTMVDETGNVEQLTPHSGHPVLVSAAMHAVLQWKYSPTLVNGKPVPVISTVTLIYEFR